MTTGHTTLPELPPDRAIEVLEDFIKMFERDIPENDCIVNMHTWLEGDTECGAFGCALGWYGLLRRAEFEAMGLHLTPIPESPGDAMRITSLANPNVNVTGIELCRIFGIPTYKASWLFGFSSSYIGSSDSQIREFIRRCRVVIRSLRSPVVFRVPRGSIKAAMLVLPEYVSNQLHALDRNIPIDSDLVPVYSTKIVRHIVDTVGYAPNNTSHMFRSQGHNPRTRTAWDHGVLTPFNQQNVYSSSTSDYLAAERAGREYSRQQLRDGMLLRVTSCGLYRGFGGVAIDLSSIEDQEGSIHE